MKIIYTKTANIFNITPEEKENVLAADIPIHNFDGDRVGVAVEEIENYTADDTYIEEPAFPVLKKILEDLEPGTDEIIIY